MIKELKKLLGLELTNEKIQKRLEKRLEKGFKQVINKKLIGEYLEELQYYLTMAEILTLFTEDTFADDERIMASLKKIQGGLGESRKIYNVFKDVMK